MINPDGTGHKSLEDGHTWFWEQHRPKKCEACGKETNELYCTPIGAHNWRCRECQIALREAIPGCAEMEEDGMPYTSIPIKPVGYEDPPIWERYPEMYEQKKNGRYIKKKEYKKEEKKSSFTTLDKIILVIGFDILIISIIGVILF